MKLLIAFLTLLSTSTFAVAGELPNGAYVDMDLAVCCMIVLNIIASKIHLQYYSAAVTS